MIDIPESVASELKAMRATMASMLLTMRTLTSQYQELKRGQDAIAGEIQQTHAIVEGLRGIEIRKAQAVDAMVYVAERERAREVHEAAYVESTRDEQRKRDTIPVPPVTDETNGNGGEHK